MAVTIVDIARAVGVGEATVVRALRGSGYVSSATKARILKAAAEMNYRPNDIARSLALGTSSFVGIVANPGIISVFQPYIEPIEHGLREAGYSMLFYVSSGNHPDAEAKVFEELLSKRVAGAIVAPASLVANPQPYNALLKSDVKLVIVDKKVEGVETPQIIVNQYTSSRLATEHLISLGHRDIVYLAMPESSFIGRERARGFRDAMSAAGIPVGPLSIIETGDTEEAGTQAAARLLAMPDRPTGVITRHDWVAIGVMQAVLAAGLSIPGDISIVGHGDQMLCYALRVPLTTIHSPTQDVATLGINKLIDMLAGRPVEPVTTMLDVSLVIRSSTAPPRSHK